LSDAEIASDVYNGQGCETYIQNPRFGLGNVDNTADANKSVNYATTAGTATDSSKLQVVICQETYIFLIESGVGVCIRQAQVSLQWETPIS
jgi:hypothetical protein